MEEMIGELASRKTPVDPTLIAYRTKSLGDDPRYARSLENPSTPPVLGDMLPP